MAALIPGNETRAGPGSADRAGAREATRVVERDASFSLRMPPAEVGAGGRVSMLSISGRTFLECGDLLLETPDTVGVCLSCHDGTVGSSLRGLARARSSPATTAAPRRHDPRGGHPVGTLYPVSGHGYVPIESLDPGIILVNGRVECVTCHPGETGDGASAPLGKSVPCSSCHDK